MLTVVLNHHRFARCVNAVCLYSDRSLGNILQLDTCEQRLSACGVGDDESIGRKLVQRSVWIVENLQGFVSGVGNSRCDFEVFDRIDGLRTWRKDEHYRVHRCKETWNIPVNLTESDLVAEMEPARTVRAMKAARSDFENMFQLFEVGLQLNQISPSLWSYLYGERLWELPRSGYSFKWRMNRTLSEEQSTILSFLIKKLVLKINIRWQHGDLIDGHISQWGARWIFLHSAWGPCEVELCVSCVQGNLGRGSIPMYAEKPCTEKSYDFSPSFRS